MKRKFKYLILHCSATPEGRPISADTVRRWHTGPPPSGHGWRQVGYSDLILLDGKRHQFVKHNGDGWIDPEEITNGVLGFNSESRHVCYIGGLSNDGRKKTKDTLTEEQNRTLSAIIAEVLAYNPDVLIGGHNQFNNKGCPSFWVPNYLRERCLVKIEEKNIFTKDPFGYESRLS